MVDVKTCKKCGSQKPLSEFSKGQYGGLQARCKDCHKTGKIRGLLCGNCNTSLGLLKENIGVLNNAIKYLKRSMS